MKLGNKNIKAKRIKIVFDNSSEDYWEAASEGGIELDEAMRLITRAWEKRDKPVEPLIKDEKVRKAIKVWAEANDIRFGRRCGSLNAYSKRIVGWNAVGTTFTIEFDKDLKMYGDSITKDDYTIAELCGEEEE